VERSRDLGEGLALPLFAAAALQTLCKLGVNAGRNGSRRLPLSLLHRQRRQEREPPTPAVFAALLFAALLHAVLKE
jgi:hypothetical protein